MSQLVAIRKFIEHAKQVVRQIEVYEESGATDIPARDLFWAKERLMNMLKAAESGAIPPIESRYAELSRVIMDQWPLGHSLGNSISTVESEYIAL